MNREIKFRGKMIPENEWIFGTILRIPAPPVCFGKSETDKYYIQFPDPRYMPDWNMPYKMVQGEVNPDTIGQYTGLKDKNGKEIYEEDVVKITNKNSKVILIKPLIAQIVWSEEYLAYILITTSIKDAFENLGDYIDYDIEVIGNVFENPELLGGKNGI